MTTLFSLPKQYAPDRNGEPLMGAQLRFYASGTSTPLDTWADEGRTTANANPVTSDSFGIFPPIWLSEALYRVSLTDAGGTVQWTVDGVGEVAAARYPITAAETSAGLTEDDLDTDYEPGNVLRYGAVSGSDSSDAFVSAVAVACQASGPGVVHVPNGEWIVNTPLTINMDAVWIRGDTNYGRTDVGKNAGTVIRHTQNIASPLITFATSPGESASNGCGIENISFVSGDSDRAYTIPSAVYVEAANTFTMQNVRFAYVNGTALKIAATVQSTFAKINIHKCGRAGYPAMHVTGNMQNSTVSEVNLEVNYGGDPYLYLTASVGGQNKWTALGFESNPADGTDNSGNYIKCEASQQTFSSLTLNDHAKTAGSNYRVYISGNNNVLSDVIVRGGSQNDAIYVAGSNNVISNIIAGPDLSSSYDKYAVRLHSGGQHLVTNVTTKSCMGVYVASGAFKSIIANICVNGVQVANNIPYGIYVDGTYITVDGANIDYVAEGIALGSSAQRALICNCHISNSTIGILLAGNSSGYNSAINNHIYIATTHGIKVTSSFSVVEGNYIQTTTQHGIYVLSCTPYRIESNVIRSADAGASSTYAAIRMEGAGSYEGAIVIGNRIVGTGTIYDLQIDNTFAYTIVALNNAKGGKETSSLGSGTGNVAANNIGI